MYTECPECGIAFRVTAKVLQKANGNVRCGGCNHAFNSLEYLSEEMSGSIPADDSDVSDDALAETSRRLLKTLDELAGTREDHIEDTGVEWRVLAENLDGDYADDIEASDEMRYDDNSPLPDELGEVEVFAEEAPIEELDEDDRGSENLDNLVEAEANSDDQDVANDIQEMESEVLQIEAELAAIHTQLLSENDEQDDTKDDDGLADIDTQFNMEAEALGLETTGTTKALADDVPLIDESPSIDTEEEESDAEDTPDLLDEDDGSELGEEISAEADTEDEEIETADADHDDEFEAQIDVAASALAGIDAAENEAPEEEDAVSEYGADSNDTSLDFLALENQVTDDEDLEKQVDATADESDADEQTGESKHFVPKPTEEEMTINMEIDEEMMALALQDDEISATLVGMATPEDLLKGKAADVETIIMEGEFVRNVVEQERIDSEAAARHQFDDARSLSDTYALRRNKLPGGRRNYDPPEYAMIAGVAILGLVLLAQFVHYSREALATSGYFNQTIGPVYQLLGSPVNPEWDIKGWQFETTNGNIGETDNSLVIVSRLINQSETELPYPLVHVSLTDRWEDIMGSRVLEPGEYLAGALDPSTPVPPGQNFTAVITIENPATEATGFKLYVCYRQEPGVVRCAIEDFK